MKNLIIIFLLSASVSFGQTVINGARLQDNSVPQSKLTADALRPVNGGALALDGILTFDQVSKKQTLAVTSDVPLTMASSGNIADSRIVLTATGNGINTISFPSDWVIDPAGEASFNPNATNKIQLDYDGNYVLVKIIYTVQIIIPTLANAVMTEGTDDLNLTFSFPVTITTAGWTLIASGGAVTVSSVVSGSGTTSVVFDLSRNITSGEDMSISYNPATGATVSATGNEIAAISNTFVDTGEETLPDNSITVDDSGGKDYTTITAASNAATSGQIVVIYAGTYRETVPGKTGVTYQPATGETVIISGLNQVTDSWTSHDLTGGKSIYKAVITGGMPVDNTAGYNLTISNSNTTLFNNQVFKDGAMQFEARYPNATAEADLLDFTKMRHYSQITSFNTTQIIDTGIPATGLTGAKVVIHGWFWNRTRAVTSQPSQSTLNWSGAINNSDEINKYRHYYYVCGKLVLLDAAKEWHYDNATNTLYLWQTGGGSPTGVEYKARNWGFDLRGVDNVTIKGLTFIGCEVATGSITTDGVTIDNVRATYTNHDVMYEDNFPGYGNATETGLMLLGINNTVKNSEFRYTAGHGIWVGTGGIIQNNWYRDCGYDGSWGAPFSFAGANSGLGTTSWGDADNVKILNNTVERTGRSAIDMSPSYTSGSGHDNLNIEIAYNDISGWGMINVDLGAIYSWGFRNLTGSSYHHNWFHHDGVVADPSGAALHGGQRAIYFDQASGPTSVHHNIISDCWTGLPTNASDMYNQMSFEHRVAGSTLIYNNDFLSANSQNLSYTTYEAGPKDVFRNNILANSINMVWGTANPPNEQYNLFDKGAVTQSGYVAQTGSVYNADFTGTNVFAAGSGSLAFIPSTGSLARNTGTVLAGITDDDDGTPDKGARRFGDPAPWVPGYIAVTLDDDVSIENNNLVFTSYSVTPTVFNNAVFSGGSASFFNTASGQITVTFTGTGVEVYAEESDNKGIYEVQIDNVRQDCDSGTGGTQDCDMYAATTANNSTLIFSATGLSAGSHTIELINTNTKNASSADYFIVYDALKIVD